MASFLLKRVLQALLTLWLVSLGLFVGIFAIGDPVAILISPDAGPEDARIAAEALGLDQPAYVQYLTFLGNLLTGSLGKSFAYNQPVGGLILQRLPATLELAVIALIFTIIGALPIGLWSGLRPHAIESRVMMAGSVMAFSLPTFWFGLILVMVFSVSLGWLPSGGRGQTASILGMELSVATLDGLRYLILPAFSMALYNVALVARVVRAGVREIMQQDFIRYAYAKGLSERRIVFVHLLRNILVPVVTVLGVEFGHLIALTVVIETIFSWPGLGQLLIKSIYQLDRPVVVGVLLTTVSIVIVINLVVDLLYGMLDPRARIGGTV